MAKAFGAPGHADTWQHADKDAVGAAFQPGNRIWFTLWKGALTEVMYPTVDSAQIRDLKLVVSDGKSYVHAEGSDFESHVSRLESESQGYRFEAVDRHSGYKYEKEVVCDPELPCVLEHYRIASDTADGVQTYFICNPHLRDKEGGAGC